MTRYFRVRIKGEKRTMFVRSENGVVDHPVFGRALIGSEVTRDGDPLENKINLVALGEADCSRITELEEDLFYGTLVALGTAKVSRSSL